MPSPRLDDALLEYSFTQEEAYSAQILSPLQIMFFQTLYAKYFKVRGSMKLPEDLTLNREYTLSILELDGKLAMLQELMDNHKNALQQLSEVTAMNGIQAPQDLATRASKQVNN